MPTIRELSDGQRALWDESSPETTVLVFKPHPDAVEKLSNNP